MVCSSMSLELRTLLIRLRFIHLPFRSPRYMSDRQFPLHQSSRYRLGRYAIAVTINAASNPISPILRPTGPVYHAVSMPGTTKAKLTIAADMAAKPLGSFDRTFHASWVNKEKSIRRKTTISSMMIASKQPAQYPLIDRKLCNEVSHSPAVCIAMGTITARAMKMNAILGTLVKIGNNIWRLRATEYIEIAIFPTTLSARITMTNLPKPNPSQNQNRNQGFVWCNKPPAGFSISAKTPPVPRFAYAVCQAGTLGRAPPIALPRIRSKIEGAHRPKKMYENTLNLPRVSPQGFDSNLYLTLGYPGGDTW